MVSRSALVDRVLSHSTDTPCTSRVSPTWTNIKRFEEDTLGEVEVKMATIDNEIWAKAIVMERGTRTAKVRGESAIESKWTQAYLRNQRIWMDGTLHEFDGMR